MKKGVSFLACVCTGLLTAHNLPRQLRLEPEPTRPPSRPAESGGTYCQRLLTAAPATHFFGQCALLPGRPGAMSWACATCTFINYHVEAPVCEICATTRTDDAPKRLYGRDASTLVRGQGKRRNSYEGRAASGRARRSHS